MYIYIYIFKFAYVAWCLFMPVCLPAPVTLFVRLWSRWNGTWTFCHQAEFTETGLVLACGAVFRLCIYALDNRSNLYHRLAIHVCLPFSVLIQISSRRSFMSLEGSQRFISRPSS